MKKILVIALLLWGSAGKAQELQARVSVVAQRVSSQVDKKIFTTLQTALNNFMNARKWTTDTWQPQERIKCNFLITVTEDLGNNVFKASLTVQAARPVYGTSYESALLNFQDNDFVFKYIEFQPVEFNENRVQGNDPLASNITAMLAYYANLIIGLDYDSFGPRGGDPYFIKAQNIVNQAPEGRDISGWKAFDGVRNRFRLIENLTDNRFTLFHDAVYGYYRNGFDQLTSNEDAARANLLTVLNNLESVNRDNPNMMFLAVFFQGKSNELFRVFSKAKPEQKQRARELLSRLDVTNTQLYKDLK
ncbi:DUF4835 family protein [Flaviaesturariibacter aridisoli]|uniref:DUF4835 family protein n=1 Tax=Flaviaesturariibacter aridisoli TaxID=2545761 RepID=A0A4R4E2J7_9BACT|nr:DUF4835 family protein [Flaviaesturariibacter aridisoli]TCZ73003.1 DUF4835 family protein [Flaviaesturariibacter aridisoli]